VLNPMNKSNGDGNAADAKKELEGFTGVIIQLLPVGSRGGVWTLHEKEDQAKLVAQVSVHAPHR